MRADSIPAIVACGPYRLAVMAVGAPATIRVEFWGEFEHALPVSNGGSGVSLISIDLAQDVPVSIAAAVKAAGYEAAGNGLPGGMVGGKFNVVSGSVAWNTGGSSDGSTAVGAPANSGLASAAAAPTAFSGPPVGPGDTKYWGLYR